MNYEIKKATTLDDGTVNTLVDYEIDGEIVSVMVAHFQPKTKEDIILGIENRAFTERKNLQAKDVGINVIDTLELNKKIEIVEK